MRVKRFVGLSMQEAIGQVRAAFGDDAVILHTRRFRPNPLFFWQRPQVEVIVAVERPPGAERIAAAGGAGARPPGTRPAAGSGGQVSPPLSPARSGRKAAGPVAAAGEAAATPAFREELLAARQWETGAGPGEGPPAGGTRRKGRSGPGQAAERGGPLPGGPPPGAVPGGEGAQGAPAWQHSGSRAFHGVLLAHQVEPALAAELAAELDRALSEQGAGAAGGWKETGAALLHRRVPTAGVWPRDGTRRVVALVGPTGVGKTTTLAKLAANFSLIGGRQVALVSADTYRIAAVEQLRTYAEIIGVPLSVVFTPAEMRAAVQRYESADLILIDTAGRSPRNEMHLAELGAFLEAAGVDEVHLVVAANTRAQDLRGVIGRFRAVRLDRLIVTKLDETDAYGTLVNAAAWLGRPISYLTTGQCVPDDIEAAEGDRIAALLLEAGEHG